MLTDEVCAVLKAAACELHLKKWDRMPIASDVCDGIIETKWDTHAVESRSGVLFRTQLEGEKGDYFVNFLLHTKDLEHGAEMLRELNEQEDWGVLERQTAHFPVEEMYRFYNLRHRTRPSLH